MKKCPANGGRAGGPSGALNSRNSLRFALCLAKVHQGWGDFECGQTEKPKKIYIERDCKRRCDELVGL